MINRSGRAVSAHNYNVIARLLPGSRQRVYHAFQALDRPATTNEAIIYLQSVGQSDGDLDSKGCSARVSELIASGHLQITGTVEDPFSFVQARTYVAVPEDQAVPIQFKRPSRKQLEAQVAHLQQKLARQQHKVRRTAALLLMKLHSLQCRLQGR